MWCTVCADESGRTPVRRSALSPSPGSGTDVHKYISSSLVSYGGMRTSTSWVVGPVVAAAVAVAAAAAAAAASRRRAARIRAALCFCVCVCVCVATVRHARIEFFR
jgi:N-formylglutamate amidohydrolase